MEVNVKKRISEEIVFESMEVSTFVLALSYVDSCDVALGIVVQDDTARYLHALRARPGREIDIEGIGVLVVVQFHVLNLLSGKAL